MRRTCSRGWPGSAGRGRWRARRGTGATARAPARSRRRAAAAGRRRGSTPCGRPGRVRSSASSSSSARRRAVRRSSPNTAPWRAQLVAHALVVAGAVALADVADGAPHRARLRRRRRGRRPRRRPAVGAIRVVSMRMVVDLPAPLGPSTATSSPGAMSRSSAPHGVHGAVAAGEVLGESPGADHDDNGRSHSGHFLSAMDPAPTMRTPLAHGPDGWHPCARDREAARPPPGGAPSRRPAPGEQRALSLNLPRPAVPHSARGASS